MSTCRNLLKHKASYLVTPNVPVCFCARVFGAWIRVWTGQEPQQRGQALRSDTSPSIPSMRVSLCEAGEGAFPAVAKCSFLQDKAQQPPLVARSNPTLCFWWYERRVTSPPAPRQECEVGSSQSPHTMTHTDVLATRRHMKCHNFEKANKQGAVQAFALCIS